jgi:hypothetical protein
VRSQLLSAGLTASQFNSLVLRSPLAMLLNPVHVSAKLEGLKVRQLLADCLCWYGNYYVTSCYVMLHHVML